MDGLEERVRGCALIKLFSRWDGAIYKQTRSVIRVVSIQDDATGLVAVWAKTIQQVINIAPFWRTREALLAEAETNEVVIGRVFGGNAIYAVENDDDEEE